MSFVTCYIQPVYRPFHAPSSEDGRGAGPEGLGALIPVYFLHSFRLGALEKASLGWGMGCYGLVEGSGTVRHVMEDRDSDQTALWRHMPRREEC